MMPTRILLADDHALIRAGIRNALKNEPHLEIVGEVGDGVGLLPAINSLQPDLLLIDVTMPQFDPIPTIRNIRLLYPDMKILVVSAYDDDVYVQGLLRAGVNGYHLKDQTLSDLRLAVKRVLEGARWITSSLVEKLISPAETKPTLHLSPRQLDILPLLAQGLDNRAIAAELGISVKTVETHLTRLYRQLKVQSRLEAANFAHKHPEVGIKQPEIPSETPAAQPQGKQASILVVDDNRRYRERLRRMISHTCPEGAIYEAENSKEAMRMVQQLRPELIFIDVVLGDESGIQCTRQIKAKSRKSRVILMSAYPDRAFHQNGLEAGAMAFLDKKDIDADTLFQIISDTID
jgi:DNA-binding NarL/FixJ family response regulator